MGGDHARGGGVVASRRVLQFDGCAAGVRARRARPLRPAALHRRAARARCASRSRRSACPTSGAARPTRAGRWFGWQAHGGYDCSGLRLARLQALGLPGGRADPRAHRGGDGGRDPASAAPAAGRDRSPATCCSSAAAVLAARDRRRIVHEGIALSNGWMIHASAQGVYVAPLCRTLAREAASAGRGGFCSSRSRRRRAAGALLPRAAARGRGRRAPRRRGRRAARCSSRRAAAACA